MNSPSSSFSKTGGGRGTRRKKMYRLMNHGTCSVISYLRKVLVGTENTSIGDVSCQNLDRQLWDPVQLTVNFFQSKLLRLTDKAEYHEPCDKVKTGIESNFIVVSLNS